VLCNLTKRLFVQSYNETAAKHLHAHFDLEGKFSYLFVDFCVFFLFGLFMPMPSDTVGEGIVLSGFLSAAFVRLLIRLSRQISLPWYLMQGQTNLNETYREYLLASTEIYLDYGGQRSSRPSRWRRHLWRQSPSSSCLCFFRLKLIWRGKENRLQLLTEMMLSRIWRKHSIFC